MRVLCGVRFASMGLRQEEDHIQPMEDDIKSRLCYASSSGASQRNHAGSFAVHYGINGLVKMCQRVAHS